MGLIDPTKRHELTGLWAGFGFQQGHMWTPEGFTLYPEQMAWWSLTCNIAREWTFMMAERRGEVIQGMDRPSDRDPRVSILRHSLQASRPRVRR
ncbi:hypothetical protein CSC78_10400 [Pseudoxanthomonas japonensis]|uniref:Uncharacterized protein n=1 Tax=Pseudoxanthomonas japonensis TaxID=69284 RepID=A0ABQ6ZGV0_9GAMM|nr:hypothetical protein CSC78_10400 [Pseudoxanthomonas japonensis]